MTSPSGPLNIGNQQRAFNEYEGILGSHNGTPMGTPDLRALRAQYSAAGTPPPNIPPRLNSTPATNQLHRLPSMDSTPGLRPGPSELGGISARRPSTPSSSNDVNRMDLDDLPDEEKAKVLRRHLVSREERQAGPDSDGSEQDISRRSSVMFKQGANRRQDTDPFPVPYDAPGADVTHDIYKWQSDQWRQGVRVRSASYAAPPAPTDPAFEHIHEPGGFRRNYVLLRANQQGTEEPRMLNNFIDFLFIFGHFAGEDLEEDEDDDRVGDEEAGADDSPSAIQRDLSTETSERQPLLGNSKLSRSRSRSRRRRMSVSAHGDATVTEAVLMLLKAFVGTGVLFLGKAFFNGGILFSALTLTFICLISLHSFLLLVQAKFVVPGSFGDIGGALYGPWMRIAILSSITISQIGFVAAYTIFVSQNLQAFVMAITHCVRLISVQYFILIQLVIFLPLALIRNLAKLSTTALVADVFILAGLIYIFGSEMSIIAKDGLADVKMFNAKDFPLFIGTAVFSFEGVGLVIPITDSMREPRKFPAVLTGVMILLLFLFGGAGVLSYLAFGSNIQTVVIVNLDSESKLTQAVQFLYSLAILLSVPLQLFPAVRIMENGIFIKRSGKADTRVKWLKNLFRCVTVFMCAAISWAGAKDLDKFVAFVGSFACVPLCYIYPAMIHYKACAKTRKEKVADITLMIFGFVAAVYTTVQTIRLMMEPEAGGAPQFGKCVVPPTL